MQDIKTIPPRPEWCRFGLRARPASGRATGQGQGQASGPASLLGHGGVGASCIRQGVAIGGQRKEDRCADEEHAADRLGPRDHVVRLVKKEHRGDE